MSNIRRLRTTCEYCGMEYSIMYKLLNNVPEDDQIPSKCPFCGEDLGIDIKDIETK